MAQDNGPPPAAEESRTPQARRLTEQALEAERAGDTATAERLFAEAERMDPGAASDVLAEDDATAALRPTRPAQARDLGGGDSSPIAPRPGSACTPGKRGAPPERPAPRPRTRPASRLRCW